MLRQPGMEVIIIEDCRNVADVSGQKGIYEGDFPRGAVVFNESDAREVYYDAFVSGELVKLIPYWCPRRDMAHPLGDGYPVVYGTDPEPPYWFETRNPRIRLTDGSIIWGDECWWGPVEGAPLEEAKQKLEEHKSLMREAMQALSENSDPSYCAGCGAQVPGGVVLCENCTGC